MTSWREHTKEQKRLQQELDSIYTKMHSTPERTMKASEQKKKEIRKAMQRIKMGEKAWRPASKPKDTKENIPTFKILAERKVTMIELDIDANEATQMIATNIARQNILNDTDALFNYGFGLILKNLIQQAKAKR